MILLAAVIALVVCGVAAAFYGRRLERENARTIAALRAEGKPDDVDVKLLAASCRAGTRMDPRRPRR